MEQGTDKLDLGAIREHIDSLDERIHALLNERASLAQQVGISKTREGRVVDFYRPEREAEVLRMALERNRGPLRDEEIVRLFREIMSACLAQQEPLKVAFLGPEGTFTQQAVFKQFGHSVRALPLPSIEEVFHEVEAGVADFGVVPIENSTEGSVNNTLDRFLSSPLHICGEVEVRIHQHLMGRMDTLERIERVVSHQQSLAQCRQWLDEHLPGIERLPASSNAEAARRSRDERGTAAIGGQTAAEVYGLTILANEIEDRPDNTTRFLVIGEKTCPPTGNDRTSILFAINDRPGSLVNALKSFEHLHINLSKIESRPSKRKDWEYIFHVDLSGHCEDENVSKALADLANHCSMVKILGSYPDNGE
jgi:chorismate mutase/prephenate dehydratase